MTLAIACRPSCVRLPAATSEARLAERGASSVVLFIYNRPELTARVFDAISRARPSRLFVFADGPRLDRADDLPRTEATRAATDAVGWPCDVEREYSPTNMGIKTRVETGLRRVFDRDDVDGAIVLEDDCVPDPTFFDFCGDLLDRYRHDDRVMSVCGSRLTPPATNPDGSYSFSRYPFLWGWATWRRAWTHYDGVMRAWPRLRADGWLDALLDNRMAVAYWTYQFDRTYSAGASGDWDIAWLFSSWRDAGLSIVPGVNLVSNLGFQTDATHTRDGRSIFAAQPSAPMTFPLRHPPAIVSSTEEDRLAEATVFSGNLERLMGSLHQRVARVGA
jgi:hypothetical protein